MNQGSIYICYRHDDAAAHAGRLYDRLIVRFPGRIAMDIAARFEFSRSAESIENAMRECRIAIVLIGKRWLNGSGESPIGEADNYVHLEIATALRLNLRIVPVLVAGAALPERYRLPEDIAPLVDWQALRIDDDDFEKDCARLIRSLESVMGKAKARSPVRRGATKTRASVERTPRIQHPPQASEPRRNVPADIFLSYAREDLPRAREITALLKSEGWEAFWDRRIPPGRNFEDYIAERLQESRAVIVLWSPSAVASPWVRREAAYGRDRNILVPALIEPASIPFGFVDLHAADLTSWRPGDRGLDLLELFDVLENLAPRRTD